ncbi:25422_t:CDS:2 [Dentiscutata erythropus]|uniref:25422_t:CDS:1 n=1 Tax=Dentiscutata erythropus TaxID=1348616 RepID=A0A9N9NDJ1_9GLOM|nr:25422_t:CDS:2 [Dentiscutata erythropus]
MNNKKLYQIRDNAVYKEQANNALVEFIVTDSQPFYMLENSEFIKYSLALGPSYKLPSNKGIKSKIYLTYDWMSTVVCTISSLKKLLDTNNNIQIIVDLDNLNTVFDDNLDLQKEIEFIDKPEILNIEMKKK